MKTVKLDDLSLKVSSGLTPLRSNKEFWDNGTIPWLKTEQLGEKYIFDTSEYVSQTAINKTALKVFPENTLSIAMYGEGKTRGNVSIIKKPMTTNQACCNVELDKEKADYEYVYYFLKTQYEGLRSLSSGVRKNLNSNDIKNYPIRLPENIEEQQKIASVLSTLDEKIALNNQINATLEQMAKTLYDYWFVQFDFPDENGKPYKSSGGEMVYNETLKRDIPKGWEVKEIQDFCRIFTGKKDVNQASEMGQYKFFSCAPNFKYSNEKLFEGKAILVSGNGSYTGRTIFVNDAFDLYQRTYAVVSKTDLDVLEYIFYSMLRSFVPKVSGGTHGSAIPYIVFNDIAKETILFHENVVDRFMHIIINIQKQVIDLSEQNYKLTEMRDWLLPMLMNGQVTVQ